MPLIPRETQIVRRIIRWLHAEGHFAIKIHGSAMQRAGLPDIIACVKGRYVGIEVKRPGNGPTPLQKLRLQNIRDAGGIAGVAACLEDAVALVNLASDHT